MDCLLPLCNDRNKANSRCPVALLSVSKAAGICSQYNDLLFVYVESFNSPCMELSGLFSVRAVIFPVSLIPY